MNVLYDSFPESVMVDNVSYEVVTDFRDWIKFCDLIETDQVPEEQKPALMLEWYEGVIPTDIEKAILALGEFMAAYPLYENNASVGKNRTNKRAYSFSQDAGDIYSAFLTCYSIDLATVKYMHWWKFRTLFDSLPNDCEIKQKMYYRTLDPSTIKNREERKRVIDIQNKIKLTERKNKYVDDYEIGDAFA